MKKGVKFIIIAIVFIVIGIGLVLIALRGDEDDWIKDSKGVWIKHGNPAKTPENVRLQQEAISCGKGLFDDLNEVKNSQCLGKCLDYSIDIVHVPRSAEDNKPENQCADFKDGVTHKFIELDSSGDIVRVVE